MPRRAGGPCPEHAHPTEHARRAQGRARRHHVKGVAELGDQFGSALAIADFDGDGSGDVAVGVPGEGIGGRVNAGAVNVRNHRFGANLAAGDVSRNGRADLAVGIPGGRIGGDRGGDSVAGHRDAGAVNVLSGSATGGPRRSRRAVDAGDARSPGGGRQRPARLRAGARALSGRHPAERAPRSS